MRHILTKKSRVALRIAKKALNGIEPFDVDANYRWEQGFTYEMYLHEDSQRARDAFVETGNSARLQKEITFEYRVYIQPKRVS